MNITKISTILFIIGLLIYFTEQHQQRDYYKVLNVPKTATPQQIKRAYHKLSLKYHPDKNKEPGAEEKFIEISNAYQVLSDPEKRKEYDQFGFQTPGGGGGAQGQRGPQFEFKNPFEFFKQFSSSFSFNFGDGMPHGHSQQQQFRQQQKPQAVFEGSGVPVLDEFQWSSLLSADKDVWLVQLFVNDDPQCHQFRPAFEKTSEFLKNLVKTAAYDCTKKPTECLNQFTKSTKSKAQWPLHVLLLSRKQQKKTGKKFVVYSGQLTAPELTKFARNYVPDESTPVQSFADLKNFFTSSTKSKVLFFTEQAKTPATLQSLSHSFAPSLDFGLVMSTSKEVKSRFYNTVVRHFPSLVFIPSWVVSHFQSFAELEPSLLLRLLTNRKISLLDGKATKLDYDSLKKYLLEQLSNESGEFSNEEILGLFQLKKSTAPALCPALSSGSQKQNNAHCVILLHKKDESTAELAQRLKLLQSRYRKESSVYFMWASAEEQTGLTSLAPSAPGLLLKPQRKESDVKIISFEAPQEGETTLKKLFDGLDLILSGGGTWTAVVPPTLR